MNGSAWSIFILFLRHIFGNMQFKLNFESFVCQLKMKRDWVSLLTKPISDISKCEFKTMADSDRNIFIGHFWETFASRLKWFRYSSSSSLTEFRTLQITHDCSRMKILGNSIQNNRWNYHHRFAALYFAGDDFVWKS